MLSPATPIASSAGCAAARSVSAGCLSCLHCWWRSSRLSSRQRFPRGTTLQALMFQVPELGLLSLAMAIPLISGGINLAIIATANLSALLMAWILVAVMPPEAAGSELAFVAAPGAGRWSRLVRDHRLSHRPAGRRRRRPSDPGDARHHDAASRHQHIFYPRTHAVRVSRTADRGRQRDGVRHPDLILAVHLGRRRGARVPDPDARWASAFT